MSKKVIVIGAGIAGLSLGLYLLKSGFDVKIFEMNDKCGGLCTTTKKKNYLFESCLYWVFGTSSTSSLNKIWKELGVIQNCQFINFEEYMRLEYDNGKIFKVYSNLEKLLQEFKKISPEDSKILNNLFYDAKKLSEFNLPFEKPISLWNLKDYWINLKKVAPFIHLFFKYKNLSIKDFTKKLKSNTLKKVFLDLMDFFPDYPMLMCLLIFSSMDMGNANYPQGGSLFLAQTIEKEINSINDDCILYNNEVEKIIIENQKATGIILKNGEKHYSDYVVSCSDGYNTLFNMIGKQYVPKRLAQKYKTTPIFHSYMQIAFGVNRDMSNEPQFVVYKFKDYFKIGNKTVDNIRIRHYCFNTNFADNGKSSLVITFDGEYEYWNDLYNESYEKYQSEKERVAKKIINILDGKFPNIKNQIEMVDVATPKTFEKFTKNLKGSAEGWAVNCKTLNEHFPYQIKKINNFYMAGHWTNINGGIITAAITARQVAQLICHNEKNKFIGESI